MICTKHFADSDILKATQAKAVRLRKGAAPAILEEHNENENECQHVNTDRAENACEVCASMKSTYETALREKAETVAQFDIERCRKNEKIKSMTKKLTEQAHDIALMKKNLSSAHERLKKLKEANRSLEKQIACNRSLIDGLEVTESIK